MPWSRPLGVHWDVTSSIFGAGEYQRPGTPLTLTRGTHSDSYLDARPSRLMIDIRRSTVKRSRSALRCARSRPRRCRYGFHTRAVEHARHNRHRGTGRPASPATPPYMRVRIRRRVVGANRFSSLTHTRCTEERAVVAFVRVVLIY
jgi:hypothetical protein